MIFYSHMSQIRHYLSYTICHYDEKTKKQNKEVDATKKNSGLRHSWKYLQINVYDNLSSTQDRKTDLYDQGRDSEVSYSRLKDQCKKEKL